MAAKTEYSSPSKLSPNERLARKRAAARLRQQRCRARKRLVLVEQRRQEGHVRSSPLQDSRTPPAQDHPQNQSSAFRSSQPSEVLPPPSEPIYNCVSFDSQRSMEEAQRSQALPSKAQRTAEKTPIATLVPSTPSPKRENVVTPEEKADETLVPEEEAAIAAMLSLKTGQKTPPTSPKVTPKKIEQAPLPRVVVRAAPRGPKFRYYRGWEPRRYEGFEYGRSPYYPLTVPPIPPHHYRYYPTYTSYGRYEQD